MPRRLSPTGRRVPSRVALPVVFVTAALLACGDSSPAPMDLDPRFAPGGGGPPVKVVSTDPSEGEQTDTLFVRVIGASFEPGAAARFYRPGVPPRIQTLSTTYVGPDELLAHIIIDGTAEVGLYDVEVTTPGGKKGVGTELFAVKEKGKPVALEERAMEYAISDLIVGLSSDGDGTYADGVDSVWAVLLDDGDYKSETGTIRMGHVNAWGIDEAGDTVHVAGTVPTRIGTVGGSPYMGVETVRLRFMAPGDTGVAVVGVHFYFPDGTYTFRFGRDCPGNRLDATRATAIRHDAETWTLSGDVSTLCVPYVKPEHGKTGPKGNDEPYPGHPAYLPFHVTLRLKQ